MRTINDPVRERIAGTENTVQTCTTPPAGVHILFRERFLHTGFLYD